jgi:periplasmic protein TonB
VTTTDNKKPKEDDPKVAAVQTSASEESVAQEATARQNIEGTRESNTPTVVHQGIGKDAQQIVAKWQHQLAAYLNLHLRYPEVEKARKEIVKVKVSFVLDRLGHIVSTRVVQGSGDAAYDAAALEMFRKSDPVPRPPPAQADETLEFTQDVLFRPSDFKKKS